MTREDASIWRQYFDVMCGRFRHLTWPPTIFTSGTLKSFIDIACFGTVGGIVEIGQFTPPHIFPWEWVPSRRHTSGVDGSFLRPGEVGMLLNAPG